MRWGAHGNGSALWRGATVWLTGLPAAGKTTTADAVAARLRDAGYAPFRLDGDVLRAGLNEDLGFDAAGRRESVRRAAEVARMLADAGLVVVVSLISPYGEDRARARRLHDQAGLLFLEVFLDTPLAVCQDRDPRHLYDRARRGEIAGVTGVDDPYERPEAADLVLRPGPQTVAEAADAVTEALLARGLDEALRPSRTAPPAP
jgi:bifunctional enzyme CysN/CysC